MLGRLRGTGNTDRRELWSGHWEGVYLSVIVLTLSNYLRKAHNARPKTLENQRESLPGPGSPDVGPIAALGANRS